MSTPATIQGRPLPFEIHTAFLQFFTLAMGTPNEVGEMSVDLNAFSSLEISVYPGGYQAGKDKVLRQSIYFHDGKTVEDVLKECAEMRTKIDALLASGRQIKINALKEQAAALLKQAEAMESTLPTST